MTVNPEFLQGKAAIEAKKISEAVGWFQKAVERDPGNAQALAALGQALCWEGRQREGLDCLHRSGKLLLKNARKTGNLNSVLMLIDQLHFWGDFQGALPLSQQAVRLQPGNLRTWQLLALTCLRLNLTTQALEAARQALRKAPDSPVLQLLFATTLTLNGDYEKAHTLLDTLLSKHLTPEQRFRTHKELARVLDKRHQYEAVFPHLYAAADIARELPQIQKQDRSFVPKIIETYQKKLSPKLLNRFGDKPFTDSPPAPVFLIGFMRSGTTLTQQVLNSHPEIFVADEPDLISLLRRQIDPDPHKVPDRLAKLEKDQICSLRHFYHERIQGRYGDIPEDMLLVDKTTMNIIDLGIIHTVFPDSRIIFLIRDPRDVCLSCFLQIMEPSPSTVHLYYWKETALYYRTVMEWWQTLKARISIPWIEVRYEEAVTQFESCFRNVLDFLDLDWHSNMTNFHSQATGNYIASPSFNQVTQPLYHSSVGRWRHYQAETEKILPILSPSVASLGYTENI